MKKWRILETIEESGAKQMAIDEAMLISRINNLVPNTLRFFTWKPSAITIGFFQDLEQEIDLNKAKDLGVDVVRRYSGGGAVFHEDELTYSLVVSEKDVSLNVLDSYKYLCQGVVEGLKNLGIEAKFKPINDILVNGKKISGNAQTRKKGVILQHGTILLSVDVEKMFSLLKVSNEKLKGKLIAGVKEGVTSIKNELVSSDIDLKYLEKVFRQGFAQSLKVDFNEAVLSKEEKEIAQELQKDKYLSKEWNYNQKYNNRFYGKN
ncbi:MAG TPA: biotin/lipoate A/B protein ligase family protein [Patescibacteria group bacterium]|nr:biotin/lipoate A/B protein ligase family protein [Patescibacteria group bacterium]